MWKVAGEPVNSSDRQSAINIAVVLVGSFGIMKISIMKRLIGIKLRCFLGFRRKGTFGQSSRAITLIWLTECQLFGWQSAMELLNFRLPLLVFTKFLCLLNTV